MCARPCDLTTVDHNDHAKVFSYSQRTVVFHVINNWVHLVAIYRFLIGIKYCNFHTFPSYSLSLYLSLFLSLCPLPRSHSPLTLPLVLAVTHYLKFGAQLLCRKSKEKKINHGSNHTQFRLYVCVRACMLFLYKKKLAANLISFPCFSKRKKISRASFGLKNRPRDG